MKKLIIVLFMMGVFASSCKKTYLEINQNPNQPTQVTPNVVLSAALVGTAANQAGDFLNVNRWMGYWSRSGNYVPDVQTETYDIPSNYTDAEWSAIYTNLNNYDYIEKKGHEENLPFYIGVAKTMKAFNFAILVDCYGSIIYKDAFQVADKVQPSYDDGQTVYNDLISQLDSAFDYFETAKTFYASAPSSTVTTDDQYDVMFGSVRTGSTDPTERLIMWQKFVNTEELKLLIHQSAVGSGTIQAEISKINERSATAGIDAFLGANESASVNPGYQPSAGKINPFYGIFYSLTGPTSTQNYYRANTYAVDFYSATGDVRQAYFYGGYTLTPGSNYDGDPAALTNSFTVPIGAPSGVLKGFTQDQLILSDFESLFLQAEAAQRGWIEADARSLYESAVAQNFVYLYKDFEDPSIVPQDDAAAYLNGDIFGNGPTEDVNWDASEDKLRLILTQKWAALNGINWEEAWEDYRRTGFPTTDWLDISHSQSHVANQIPIRFLFPQSEYNTNSNTPTLPDKAQFTSKIFWQP